jgi:AraC family transcriptional regulator
MVSVAEPAPAPLRLATWHAGDGDRVRITPLYRSPIVSMGTFYCAPDDVRWSLENVVGEVAHIVFPTMPVWIGTEGHELTLAGPNHAIFFNAGEVFRRRRFNGGGDRNDSIVVGQDTLDEWLREARFPGLLGKLPPRPYLTVRAIARALANGGDGLLVEEALLRLGHATVTGAFRPEQWAPRRRRRPPPLVEDAKAVLSARFTEHLTLEELGRAVNVSPFHLARSFRRHTGFTLHEYRVNLRLKAALERLAAGDEDVAVIARAVGFSSHSHLTATFHRAFGIPPSCVRKRSLPPYA